MQLTTHLRHRLAGLLAFALLSLLLFGPPAVAQRSAPPKTIDVGPEHDDTLGYGIDLKTGQLALEVNKVSVFCADSGILVAHPDHLETVQKALDAKDQGDDIWEIEGKSYLLQKAESVYESQRRSIQSDDLKRLHSGNLEIVRASRLFLPTISTASGCQVLWQGRKCDEDMVPFTCPDPSLCFGDRFGFEESKRWWSCTNTGNPFDFCAEWFQNVCTLNEYTCDDCKGPIVSQIQVPVSACVVLP